MKVRLVGCDNIIYVSVCVTFNIIWLGIDYAVDFKNNSVLMDKNTKSSISSC
jgi:hypothetical protein